MIAGIFIRCFPLNAPVGAQVGLEIDKYTFKYSTLDECQLGHRDANRSWFLIGKK